MIKNILFIWCRRLSSVWQMGSRPSLSLVQYLLIQPNKVVFLLRKKYEEEKGKLKIMHDISL